MKEEIQNTTATRLHLPIPSLPPAGHKLRTADARKERILHGKIISSRLMGKAVNNYSQLWKSN